MEQLVILLLIVVISIINWIVQKSKEAREKRKLEKRADATGEPLAKPEPAPDVTETAMRRFREALGLPEDAQPPVIPKRVEEHVPAPPRPPARVPPPLPQRERKPVVVHASPAQRWEEHRRTQIPHRGSKPLVHEAPEKPSRVRELLRSEGGLRDAVVLSEILGPAKSLRERPLP